jgi:hypothetical protein
MITSIHTLIYSDDAPATRAFLRDVLGLFGVNYFFALTTTISPDERQLRF